ncbi:MAG: hypothetical protein ABW168_06245 [Sedimenticola sp.]
MTTTRESVLGKPGGCLINPYLEFSKWEVSGDNRYAFHGRNLSHETPTDFEL